MTIKRFAVSLALAALLLGGAACNRIEEAAERDLSTTAPTGTLPVMSDSTALPPGPPAAATDTAIAPVTGTTDDSGFDPLEMQPGTATSGTTATATTGT